MPIQKMHATITRDVILDLVPPAAGQVSADTEARTSSKTDPDFARMSQRFDAVRRGRTACGGGRHRATRLQSTRMLLGTQSDDRRRDRLLADAVCVWFSCG
jgi:hypothetical protein